MPTVDVKDLSNKKVGTVELRPDVFAVKVNQTLLYEAVRQHLAGQRRGTHKVKDRSEVSGGGRKPWRQKGTGRARVGTIRSPLWRHGGTTHGPQPRDYSYNVPRKVLLGALRSALTAKQAGKKMLVIDEFKLADHKTKGFREALDKLGVDKSLLIVETSENVNLQRASGNLPRVKLVATHEVSPYDIMAHDRVAFSRAAVEKLQGAVAPRKRAKAEAKSPVKSESKSPAKAPAKSPTEAK